VPRGRGLAGAPAREGAARQGGPRSAAAGGERPRHLRALLERGWTFADVVAAVPGCATTGRVDVANDGTVGGALVVKLGAELLEKSKLTLLPSLLAGKLVVPAHHRRSVAPACRC